MSILTNLKLLISSLSVYLASLWLYKGKFSNQVLNKC